MPDLAQSLDDVIDRALTRARVVGAVVLVAKDGQTVYARAAGHADREAGAPMTLDTVFRLSSVTKPIVATAALALADVGVLPLDAPVTRWLPDFQPKTPDGAAPPITIGQLLTHTSGLSYGFLQPPDGPYHAAGVSDGMDQPGLSLDEELARIARAGLLFPPGSAWNYSVSLDVLGAAMQAATGEPLQGLIDRLVLTPLGMTHTAFSARPGQVLATPYIDAEPQPRRMLDPDVSPFAGLAGIRYSPSRAFVESSFPSGGGGMIGTAPDTLKLLEALRQGGGGVVSPATAKAALENQIGELAVTTNGPGFGFGHLGVVLRDPAAANSPLPAGTVSWGGVYGHSWNIDPARGVTLVALTNTAIEGMTGAFPTELAAAVAANA